MVLGVIGNIYLCWQFQFIVIQIYHEYKFKQFLIIMYDVIVIMVLLIMCVVYADFYVKYIKIIILEVNQNQ